MQQTLIFGDLKNETKNLPLVVYKILNHLKNELANGKATQKCIVNAFYDYENPQFFNKKWDEIKPQLKELKVFILMENKVNKNNRKKSTK